jgi:serine/threonine-protein kinase
MTETRFGDYQILEQIGAGGMAAVYKANDPAGERVIALKVLHKHWATDREFVRRFQREAEIAGQLHHRHIIPIYDYGKAGDRPYLTMQYMAGGSLAQLLRKPARLSLSISARILIQIAAALDYAHQRGVVHRDLKLENILLDDQNRPLLADFGIARAMDATRLTATGQVTGTPLYMSPEQARGESNLSHSTDIYSLAVMAYLLATGFFPFSGSVPLVLLNQHLTMIPPTPSLVNPDLPPALDVVLLKGLAKLPDERYATAGEFARAFADAIVDAGNTKVYIVTTQANPVLPPLANGAQGSTTVRFEENNGRTDTVVLEEEPIPSPVVPAPVEAISPATVQNEERESRRRKSPILFALITLVLLLFVSSAYVLSRNQTPVGEIVPEMTEEGVNSIGGRGDGDSDLSDNSQNSSGDGVRNSPTPEFFGPARIFGELMEDIINTATPTGTLTTTVSAANSSVTGTPSGTPATSTRTPTRTRTVTPGASPTATRTRTATPTHTRTNTPIPPSSTPVPPTPIPPTPVPPTPVPPTNPPPPTDPPPAPTNPPPPPPTATPDNPLIPPLIETLVPPLCGLLPC